MLVRGRATQARAIATLGSFAPCPAAMALPSRVSAALSDLFLPTRSIYHTLDGEAEREPFDDDRIVSPSSAAGRLPNRPASSSAAPDRSLMADDDPFSSVSPSALSPARPRGAEPELAPPPHLAASIPDIDSRLHEPHSEPTQPYADDDAAQDPFRVESEAALPSRSHSRSPTPRTSVNLPAAGKASSAVKEGMMASPASSTGRARGLAAGGSQGGSASRSAIGSRSLMGLMGGTRYEGGGFPFSGVGVGEIDEEEAIGYPLEDPEQAGSGTSPRPYVERPFAFT